MKKFSAYDKILLVFLITLASYTLFAAGVKSERHWYLDMGFSLLTAGLFVAIVVTVISDRFRALHEKLAEARLEGAEKAAAAIAKAFDKAGAENANTTAPTASGFPPEMQRDLNTLSGIVKGMGFVDEPPTADVLPVIEGDFHNSTGRYVHLELRDGGMTADFNETKPELPETSSRALSASPDGSIVQHPVEEPKPLTKSQQRRLNTKKGLGPLTDEEVREKRNAERRAKRQATKDAKVAGAQGATGPTTTTTTVVE